MTKKVLFNQYYQTLSAILTIAFFINCVLISHFFKIALIEIVIPNGPINVSILLILNTLFPNQSMIVIRVLEI